MILPAPPAPEHDPPAPAPVTRLKAIAGRWIADRARRGLRQEISDYERPRVRLAPLFGRTESSAQQFRSLVQVNIYPRPR